MQQIRFNPFGHVVQIDDIGGRGIRPRFMAIVMMDHVNHFHVCTMRQHRELAATGTLRLSIEIARRIKTRLFN